MSPFYHKAPVSDKMHTEEFYSICRHASGFPVNADNGLAENGPEPAKVPSVLIIVTLKIFPKISSNQSGQHEHDVWLISTP
jgi:hypothetical protein